MGRLIDARTSQNASYANSISIVINAADTPQLVGQIGLQTAGVGSNPRVQLKGTVTVDPPSPPPVPTMITVTIVRGTLPTDLLVYSATEDLVATVGGPQVLTVSADDFNPQIPVSGQITYTLFVSSSVAGVTRVGPENFDGALYSD